MAGESKGAAKAVNRGYMSDYVICREEISCGKQSNVDVDVCQDVAWALLTVWNPKADATLSHFFLSVIVV